MLNIMAFHDLRVLIHSKLVFNLFGNRSLWIASWYRLLILCFHLTFHGFLLCVKSFGNSPQAQHEKAIQYNWWWMHQHTVSAMHASRAPSSLSNSLAAPTNGPIDATHWELHEKAIPFSWWRMHPHTLSTEHASNSMVVSEIVDRWANMRTQVCLHSL